MVISAAQVTLLFLSWLRKEGSLFIRFVFKPRRWDFRCCFSMGTGWPFFITPLEKKRPTGFVEQTLFLLWMPWIRHHFDEEVGNFLPTWVYCCMCMYIYIYISWPSIAAEFVRIHDLNPGLSLTNWGFCPPNVTPLRKWASWSGLMNHPFPLIRLASLSLGAFCSRKLYALRCLGHHFPRWGNMRKNPPTTCVHGWIFDQFLLEIFLEGWHCSKTSRNIHSWNCHVKEDLFQGWCFFDWVSKFKFQEKFSGCTFWYVFVHLSWDPKKVFQRSRTV